MKINVTLSEKKIHKNDVIAKNIIFQVSGIAIIAAGALVLTNVGQFNRFMETRIIAPPIVLIVAGTIVFIIAFLGCYGAIKENYNMLVAVSFINNLFGCSKFIYRNSSQLRYL